MRRALALVSLAFFSLPSLATPISLQFVGTMSTYVSFDDAGVGTDLLSSVSNRTVKGILTFDTSLAPPPLAVELPFGGGIYQLESNSDFPAEFVMAHARWEGGSFAPSPLAVPPGAREIGDTYYLRSDNGVTDRFIVADQFGWQAENFDYMLSRLALGLEDNFIDDATIIPTGSEFPNLASATGQAVIHSFGMRGNQTFGGFQISVDLESVSVVPRGVPEPGTFALLACGLVAMGLVRRRRGGWMAARSVPVF